MSNTESQLTCLLNFYCREKLFGHVRELCDLNYKKFPDDPLLDLYVGIACFLEEDGPGTKRIFEVLQQNKDFSYASLVALLQIYKLTSPEDKAAISELENRLKKEKRGLNSKSAYFAALIYFHTENFEKSLEFCENFSKTTEESSVDQWILKGWVDMQNVDMKNVAKSIESIKLRDHDQKYGPDLYLLSAKYNELRENFQLALDDLNFSLRENPNFLPLNVEKMKIQLFLKQWDQCAETAEKCLLIDQNCVQASLCIALHVTCYEGQYNEGVDLLTELLEILNKSEHANYKMYCKVGKLFARLCGRHEGILGICQTFVEKAVSLSKSPKAQILSELAYQYRLAGQYKQSIKFYKQAVQLSDSSSRILIEMICCLLMDGEIKEAENQLELFHAMHNNEDLKIDMQYVEILFDQSKNDTSDSIKSKLLILLQNHFEFISKMSKYGPEFFERLNSTFVAEILRELLKYVPSEPAKTGQFIDPVLKDISSSIAQFLDHIPGSIDVLFLDAKVEYLSADLDGAMQILQKCLNKDQSYLDAHLLLAKIYLQKQQYKLASQSLELGLSFNFEVRDHPTYSLLKAKILKKSNKISESIGLLENAVNSPKFKIENHSTIRQYKKQKSDVVESDRVAIYLELIDSYQAMEKMDDASKLMKEALAEFRGKNEEQLLILSNADLALNRGDVERALAILQLITSDQPNFLAARQKMADIFLHHKKDKRQFAACFKDIVEQNPSPQAFVMLGDAYMSIQEPEKAIELYESALKKNPRDHALSSKIGKALVKSHNYAKALSYYEAALKTGHTNFMRYELADLLLKLGNFDKCERMLKQGLENIPKFNLDIQTAEEEVKFFMLLSKLYFETGNWQGAVDCLLKAKQNQSKVLERGTYELADKIEEYKILAADICCQLGQFYQNKRELQKSIGFYQEALKELPQDTKLMINVAHLYLMMGDMENCYQICQNVTKIDPDNDMATLMLADLMYQRNDTDSALAHFQQLLDRNPNQYYALARAIELAWRAGDIKQAEKYLQKACEGNLRAGFSGGYNYCKGLLEWYTGDPNSALQHFNRAKRDLEWGERSIYNIVEICINPDNEIIGGEVFDSGEAIDSNTSADKQDAREVGVQTAENFLKELSSKPDLDCKYRLVKNFILLATNRKQNIEKALNDLILMNGGIENTEISNVGTILGLARAHMMLKQTPKAKTQLKRVLNRIWSFEEADYLEQCWLLLADTYINQSKFEVATEILTNCLKHNASCIKAMEFSGFIREKDQKWAEAATIYEKAWKLTKMKNPAIGYKLAMNFLKSRRYVDAIDTCHVILKSYPKYPKIRKDVLDKARANLRL